MALTLRKRGGVYHARGSVPEKQADGTVARIRIERSTGTGDRKRARQAAEQIEKECWDRAYSGVGPGATFAEAALTYMETTGNTRFITPLLDHFGLTSLSAIGQDETLAACKALYPGRTPQTWNRQVFTPVNAILVLAARQGKCPPPDLERPKGHDALPELSLPDDDWFDKVLPHCNPRAAALLLTLAMRGRRISELTGIRSKDVDADTGYAVIGRTKNGEPVLLHIPQEAFDAIDDWTERERFFGYSSRWTARNAIQRACTRAGAPFYSSHKAGRHYLSSRILKKGHSLKFLKDALGWKTIAMPARRYGFLERSEVDEQVKELGRIWGKARKMQGKE